MFKQLNSLLKILWQNKAYLYRWYRAKKGIKALVKSYNAGDLDNASYGKLEKFGIADMRTSNLGEPEFIFDGTKVKK